MVGPNGEQVGIVPISRALDMAVQADLDLVEVAPTARPPVAKIMDYGKFKYENAQKAREARRNQVLTVIKEMKLRPKIDGHDYETKKGHVVRFLKVGDKVKVTIMFRGREQSRPELGFRLLQKLAADVAELGFVESAPKLDGRNMIMVLAPHKAPSKTAKPSTAPAGGARHAGSADEPVAEETADSLQDEVSAALDAQADEKLEEAALLALAGRHAEGEPAAPTIPDPFRSAQPARVPDPFQAARPAVAAPPAPAPSTPVTAPATHPPATHPPATRSPATQAPAAPRPIAPAPSVAPAQTVPAPRPVVPAPSGVPRPGVRPPAKVVPSGAPRPVVKGSPVPTGRPPGQSARPGKPGSS